MSKRVVENQMNKEKQVPLNRFILPLLFILFAIILEIVNFLYLGFRSSSGNIMILPTYFLFDLAVILMIAGFIYVVYNKTASIVFFFFFLFIQFAMNMVNSTMYFIFGDILSYDLLRLGAEATTALSMDLIDWSGVFLNIMVFAVMVACSVLIIKFNKKTIKIKYFSSFTLVLAFFILVEAFGISLYQIQQTTLTHATSAQTEVETSDEYLWKNFQFKTEALKKFGHYGFYTKSFMHYIFQEDLSDSEIRSLQNFIDEGHVYGDPSAPLQGDNLIVILCESLEWYGIDPYNTPNLYNLIYGDNVVIFDQFYARNRTNYSEAIGLLGSVPKDTLVSTSAKAGYNFEYSLPKLFKASSQGEEIITNYLHPNFESFYDRTSSHGSDKIGFDNLYTIEDYTGPYIFTTFQEWIPEISFVQNQIDHIIPDEGRFLTYYTTLTTHGPYDSYVQNFESYYQTFDENFEKFSSWFTANTEYVLPTDEDDFKLFKIYKSAMIDLDLIVGEIISSLEEKGRDEDTSILFYSDHNAYFSDLCYKIRGTEKTDYSNTYNYNIPMFMYSKKLTNGQSFTISDFCSTYDILPTICDLYGLDSNSNLFQGYSIFSENIKDTVFVSNLSGIFTKNCYSTNISDVIIADGATVTEKEINHFKEIANRFYQKQAKIEKIYRYGINSNMHYIDSKL